VKAIMKKYSIAWNQQKLPEKKFGMDFSGGKKF